MEVLIDTNVLLHLADDRSPEHGLAEEAVEHLLMGDNALYLCTQVLVEFWAVATRPDSVNGLGWSTATAADAIRALRDQFPLLPEAPDVPDRWFELVNRCQVAGASPRRAHSGADDGRRNPAVVDVQYG